VCPKFRGKIITPSPLVGDGLGRGEFLRDMAKRSLRVEYGRYLVEMGRKYPNLIALEADLKESTQSIQFEQAFPERYIQVGIAEQNMMGIAAGLALAGKIPVTHSFACFTSMRACEQVRTTIAYPRLNVKLYASHAGISPGTAGTTHHAIEDLAIMRAIPNMTVLAPGDASELRQAMDAALAHVGPVYMRIGAGEAEDAYGEGDRFSIGKATKLRDGDDAAIISTGTLMAEAAAASDALRRDHGIKARVLQMASVKPLDAEAVVKAAAETGNIITVEEHNVLGGLGGAVAEVAAETGGARVRRLGVGDSFCGVGSAAHLMKLAGLTAENIALVVREMVSGHGR
jgi:transketolase